MLNKKNRDFTILGMFNLSLAVYNKSESNFIWLSSVPPCLSMQYLEKTTTNNKLIYLFMRLIFTLALFLLPFLEIWGLFRFASMYGWWFFGYIVIMAILGWQLIQDEKTLVVSKLMNMMTQGGNLTSVLLGSAKNLLAGALFLFPGVITDIIGFILLIIPIQNSVDPSLKSSQKKTNNSNSDVIEGEYRREDD